VLVNCEGKSTKIYEENFSDLGKLFVGTPNLEGKNCLFKHIFGPILGRDLNAALGLKGPSKVQKKSQTCLLLGAE
jgi:hypothetical protein